MFEQLEGKQKRMKERVNIESLGGKTIYGTI